MRSSRIAAIFLPLLLLVGAGLAYLPGLGGGFLFDDFPNIVTNPRIQAEVLDSHSLGQAIRGYEPGAYGRPLATLSFAVDYRFGGKDPRQFKTTNLAIHLANAWLVFLLVRSLLAAPDAGGPWSRWTPLAIAAFWAIHPLQVSTVLYVVQRMESLVAMFTLLGLLAYVRGRRRQAAGERGWPWLVAGAGGGALAMLCKESAILLPLFALALELTVLRFEGGSEAFSRRLRLAYALGLAFAAAVFFAFVVPKYAAPESFAGRNFSMTERLLSQLRILPMYVGQILLPLPKTLLFYYDNYPKSTGLLSPWTTLAGGVVLSALLVVGWCARRARPILSLGLFWFFAGHALTSNVLNLELAFEHRNYLALLGILLAVAGLLHGSRLRVGPGLRRVAIGAALALTFALTVIRSATWGDPLLLATDLVAINPGSPRASNDLATLYVDMSASDPGSPYFLKAQQEFERGSRLPGASPLPEQGLILMAATAGVPADPAWWDRLVEKTRTQPLGPEQALAVTGLMTQYQDGYDLDTRRLGEAYQALLDRAQWPGYMYANFGDFALVALGDENLADKMFLEAISADPTDDAFGAMVLATLIADNHVRQADLVRKRLEELGHFSPSHRD